jgi:demethylmenaquinone methyltransferase/2-methoxy-6-polyprenyl-1,4-benzoquinol methylase
VADQDIHNPSYVRALFDEMSETYGVVHVVSSFGFTKRWRQQCVDAAHYFHNSEVYDLMSGMGELWPSIVRRIGPEGKILALDISPVMVRKSRITPIYLSFENIEVLEENVLENSLPSSSADVILSAFGLKTFSAEQTRHLAREISRILKPGGVFSLLEISVPENRLLRSPYMFYVSRIIPIIGRLFLGNPENYRMLGIYTQLFKDCRKMTEALRSAGLEAHYREYFFGCASGIVGRKVTITA